MQGRTWFETCLYGATCQLLFSSAIDTEELDLGSMYSLLQALTNALIFIPARCNVIF